MLHSKALPKTSGAFIAQRVMSATDPENVLFRGGDPDFMTSLARGLHVIRAFAGVDRRLTIADVSRATGLTRAVVRRCLYTLRNSVTPQLTDACTSCSREFSTWATPI